MEDLTVILIRKKKITKNQWEIKTVYNMKSIISLQLCNVHLPPVKIAMHKHFARVCWRSPRPKSIDTEKAFFNQTE